MSLKEIRDRAAAASPGPWTWRGNVDTRQIYLSYTKPGLGWTSIMDFVRWGMQSARPRFITNTFWMKDADELAVFEVCRDATRRSDRRVYRGDIVGFRHPDAEFIAHARQDVDVLLAAVDAVEKLHVLVDGPTGNDDYHSFCQVDGYESDDLDDDPCPTLGAIRNAVQAVASHNAAGRGAVTLQVAGDVL